MTTSAAGAWPLWATTRAHEIREKIPPGERGPWENFGGLCTSRSPLPGTGTFGSHSAEEPWFFHCRAHKETSRRNHRMDQPWHARDHGLCTSCGAPAERTNPMTMGRACVEAEREHTTVARLLTKRHCAECAQNRIQLCQGRTCQESGNPLPVQRAGCCHITRRGKTRHCTRCCEAASASRSNQADPERMRNIGLAQGRARRERREQRLQKVAELLRTTNDVEKIAAETGAAPSTIIRDIRAIRSRPDPLQAANNARLQKARRRWEDWLALFDDGWSIDQIAEVDNVTPTTVSRRLHELIEERNRG